MTTVLIILALLGSAFWGAHQLDRRMSGPRRGPLDLEGNPWWDRAQRIRARLHEDGRNL